MPESVLIDRCEERGVCLLVGVGVRAELEALLAGWGNGWNME